MRRFALSSVLAVLTLGLILGTAEARSPARFYVSPAGNDAATGTHPTRAWRSVARVNAEPFIPGDRVAFLAGAAFQGPLHIASSGIAGKPILYTSYARVKGSRAEILGGAGTGIHLLNAGYIRIVGLQVTGAGPDANTSTGILIENASPVERVFAGITVDDIDVSGFHYAGVEVKASRFVNEAAGLTRRRGFRDLRFTRMDLHHNGWGGMWVGGCGNYIDHRPEIYCHQNLYIGRSQFHDNDGIASLPYHTGDGLYVWEVDGGTIERCRSFRNGKHNQNVSGPVGIWAYWSTRLLIQHNESFENWTANGDGGGFDLDGGVSHSVVQYNTSHGNAGAGFMVYQFPDPFRLTHHNVIRYNTSRNDARAGHQPGAIHLGGDGPLRDLDVYGNTVTIGAAGLVWQGAFPSAFMAWGDLANVRVRKNMFVATDGIPLARVLSAGVLFEGNTWNGAASPFFE